MWVGDGKECWPWVWEGGERSLRLQVEKWWEVSKFRAVDSVSKRDSGELDWGEGWGPAERARGAHQGEN